LATPHNHNNGKRVSRFLTAHQHN